MFIIILEIALIDDAFRIGLFAVTAFLLVSELALVDLA